MVIHKYNHLSSNRACERLITLCVKIQHIHSSHSFVSFNERFYCTLLLPNEWMNEWISTEKKWDLLQFLHREGDFCKYSMRSFVMKGSQLYIFTCKKIIQVDYERKREYIWCQMLHKQLTSEQVLFFCMFSVDNNCCIGLIQWCTSNLNSSAQASKVLIHISIARHGSDMIWRWIRIPEKKSVLFCIKELTTT